VPGEALGHRGHGRHGTRVVHPRGTEDSDGAGYGLADKVGVAKMVKLILKIDELPGYDDASDALAIAITAANNRRLGA